MKELKIKRAIYCLLAVAAIKTLSTVYAVISSMQALNSFDSLAGNNLWLQGIQSVSVIFMAVHIVLTYFVVTALKKDQAWAWITALCLFLYAAPSFALPACIIGFISLIDEDVRTPFINQLDIKI